MSIQIHSSLQAKNKIVWYHMNTHSKTENKKHLQQKHDNIRGKVEF